MIREELHKLTADRVAAEQWSGAYKDCPTDFNSVQSLWAAMVLRAHTRIAELELENVVLRVMDGEQIKTLGVKMDALLAKSEAVLRRFHFARWTIDEHGTWCSDCGVDQQLSLESGRAVDVTKHEPGCDFWQGGASQSSSGCPLTGGLIEHAVFEEG